MRYHKYPEVLRTTPPVQWDNMTCAPEPADPAVWLSDREYQRDLASGHPVARIAAAFGEDCDSGVTACEINPSVSRIAWLYAEAHQEWTGMRDKRDNTNGTADTEDRQVQ